MYFLESLLSLKRTYKQIIVLLLDIIAAFAACMISLIIRFESLSINFFDYIIILIISSFIFIPFFFPFGLYKAIFRYPGIYSIINIISACFIYGSIFFLIIYFSNLEMVPRSIGILQPVFFTIFVTGIRVAISLVSLKLTKPSNKKNLLIYGAGNTGVNALNYLKNFNIIGFIDDDQNKIGQTINKYKIYNLDFIGKLINKQKIFIILICIPNLTLSERREIIKRLNKYSIAVNYLPNSSDIVTGNIGIKDFKKVNIDELIDRKINWDINLIKNKIKNNVVLITGAGGSIGSELARQIIKYEPKKIILIDNNEFNLYNIDSEMENYCNIYNHPKIFHSCLSSITNINSLRNIFKTYKPDIVYHAAAYKHVPLAEKNIAEYVDTNIIGTVNVINEAIQNNAKNFIYISTDKAVRPSNIMGTTKRFSELYLKSLANQKNLIKGCKVSSIRFGNVLGSKGSVVPLFAKQIANGGPITVTHPEVSRYFMTISESVGLILYSLILSKGGEVFILNMGNPIKILDLARKMIKFSGLSEKSPNKFKNGEIEIIFLGLRAGEKLHEELMIGNKPIQTDHKDILMEIEEAISWGVIVDNLNQLKKLIHNDNLSGITNILKKVVKDFKQSN